MMNLGFLYHMLGRSYVSAAVEVTKMKALVPVKVDDRLNNYNCTIVDVVFDPLNAAAINKKFENLGYNVPENFQVIAVNEDGSILMWGGINSVYHLKKGETLPGTLEGNLAFNDIRDLINRFKFKNKKAELDELMEGLKKVYRKPSSKKSE